MHATVYHTCAPKEKAAAYEAEEITIRVELPFVPAPGTMLKLTPNGDYLRLQDVYLDLGQEGEGLALYIEEPDDASGLRPWAEMQREGWSLAGA